MAECKRVIIADEEPILRMDLKEELTHHGYLVAAETGDGVSVINLTRQLRPDLVIMDIRMPGMDGIEAAEVLTHEKIAPVVLLTAYSGQPWIERAKKAGVMNYIVKPWRQNALCPAIELALARFEAFCAVEARAQSLEEQLATRKVVERAKGLIIEQYGVTEQQAYSLLRRWSMATRKPLRAVAEVVLEMDQIARLIKVLKQQPGKDTREAGGTEGG
ncbi:MAG: ANTAR domain-containing response regulator, partial [Ktedonobacteraceae bacterium]